MAFREKSAWISLITISGIYGVYFWSIIHAGGHWGVGSPAMGLLTTIVALVVAQVVLITGAAILAPKEANAPRDEREKLIELKATRFAYSGLATGVAMACFFGAFTPPIVFNTNALLLLLVTTEIMRSASQIVQYRRGA